MNALSNREPGTREGQNGCRETGGAQSSCLIDNRALNLHAGHMSGLLRLLCVMLLAAFALGTAAQAWSVGTMAAPATTDIHAGMADLSCDNCPASDIHDGMGCADGCVAASFAALPPDMIQPVESRRSERTDAVASFESRSDPPAFTPPRPSFLI